jgi:M6 family metalloprotease-like protein
MGIARLALALALVASAAAATGSVSTSAGTTRAAASACAPLTPAVPGVTEGQSLAGTVAPSRGTLRAALLLIHPADTPPDDSVAPPTVMLDAAAEWFRSVSYGRLQLEVETVPRWLALPKTSVQYLEEPEAYLRDAVAAADPFLDFSRIDVVYLSPASRTPETRTSAILNGFGVRADGREVRAWVPWQAGFADQVNTDPWTLIHETGHLLGLPDLYSPNAPSTFYRWDVMAFRIPAELYAWHRWKLGWLDPGQIVCLTRTRRRTVTLTPIERPGGTKAVFVKRGTRILAIEARARLGYDRMLCETGILVYEVEQSQFQRAPIRLHQASPDAARSPRRDCASKWNAPFEIGRGEARTYRLTSFTVRLDLLARRPDGSYRIRIRPR